MKCKVCNREITERKRKSTCSIECLVKWGRIRSSAASEKNREKIRSRRLKLRFSILQRDNFCCVYCGRSSKESELQVDHKYPKGKGGKSNSDNYVTACKECNIGKSDSILTEFTLV